MEVTDTKEKGFESLIVKWLVEHNGYEQGNNADYNKEYAIDETRLFRFLQNTQPEQMDRLGVFKSEQKKRQFLNRLQGSLPNAALLMCCATASRCIRLTLSCSILRRPRTMPRHGKCLKRTFSASPGSYATRRMQANWRWICACSSMVYRLSHLN